MVSKWNLLRQSEMETFNKIIYGKLPVDAFDQFVANWKIQWRRPDHARSE
jgi:putative aldouronate transport system substrate-binding protein